MIVSGSAVVKSDDPKQVMAILRETTEKWININDEQHARWQDKAYDSPALVMETKFNLDEFESIAERTAK